MSRSIRGLLASAALLAWLVPPAAADFTPVFGTSWEGIPLQSVLDAEYGVGVIDVATDYEGYLPGDADPPYWLDEELNGIIIREIAGYSNLNILGWYHETLAGPPIIDGINDGVIFSGPMSQGAIASVQFPGGITQFGFYINPAGEDDDGTDPELFFTHRGYNDVGPDGSGTTRQPFDGDPQCLVYNITHLRDGVPTFVLAWEDLDYGNEITPEYLPGKTDNDYNDLVVEVSAFSPVPTEVTSWSKMKALFQD